MTLTQIKPAGLSTPVDLADNAKIRLGTGNDLQIYHDGTHSYLENATGGFYVKVGNGEFLNRGGTEVLAKFIENGAVELYYDNTVRLTTNSTGLTIGGGIVTSHHCTFGGNLLFDADNTRDIGSGAARARNIYLYQNLDILDNGEIRLGNSDDLKIYHTGTNTYISNSTGTLYTLSNTYEIRGSNGNETHFKTVDNGGVELYYDNSLMLDVKSWGVEINGALGLDDNRKLALGNGPDLEIYHDGSNSYIADVGTGGLRVLTNDFRVMNSANSELGIFCEENGRVSLYYDNSEKFKTNSAGVEISGHIYQSDNHKLLIGNAQDLQIYHDGNNTHIHNATGTLYVRGDRSGFISADGAEWGVKYEANSFAQLFYDNALKLETKTYGIFIDGHLQMDDNDRIKLGNSNDLQLYHYGHSMVQNTNSVAELLISSFGTHIVNAAVTENIAKFKENAEVELFYDNAIKFETTSNGTQVYGDVRLSNDSWTGESSTGKIQTHSGHIYMQNASNTGNFTFRLPSGTEPYVINYQGGVTTSDRRRKKDITTITGAVDTIKQLVGRSFTWKEADTKSFGLIAQEVETVLPELVTTQSVVPGETNSDPYKMLNYAALTGHLVEAIKELSTKVAALEAA